MFEDGDIGHDGWGEPQERIYLDGGIGSGGGAVG